MRDLQNLLEFLRAGFRHVEIPLSNMGYIFPDCVQDPIFDFILLEKLIKSQTQNESSFWRNTKYKNTMFLKKTILYLLALFSRIQLGIIGTSVHTDRNERNFPDWLSAATFKKTNYREREREGGAVPCRAVPHTKKDS